MIKKIDYIINLLKEDIDKYVYKETNYEESERSDSEKMKDK